MSFANDFKFAYVDVSEIFTKSSPAISLKEALNLKVTPLQNELKELNDNLTKENEDVNIIQQKNQDVNKLSSKDKSKLLRFQQDKLLFQQKYMLLQQKMQKLQDYASSLLLSKVNDILKTISEDGNYDLVLTSNQLIYTKPKYNLTDLVISKLKNIDSKNLVKQLNDAETKINSEINLNNNLNINKK
jgi:Skp family chaperone for outer membrane proteins